MASLASKLTTEQFLTLPENPAVKRELLDGEVLEVGTGRPVHERVKSNFHGALVLRLGSNPVFSEAMYHLAPGTSLQPDVSIVLSGDLDPQQRGRITIAPDVAIEVVSSESAADLKRKVQLYLSHGVAAVWVAYPSERVIDVYKAGSITCCRGGETIEDRDLLPGFSIPVDSIFEGISGQPEG